MQRPHIGRDKEGESLRERPETGLQRKCGGGRGGWSTSKFVFWKLKIKEEKRWEIEYPFHIPYFAKSTKYNLFYF